MGPPMRAHWRHLANTFELVFPSAYPSPQPKPQIDRFSRFCTPHSSKSLYFTLSPYTLQWAPLSPKLPLPMKGSERHPIHNSLGKSESTTQTASRWVQPFLHRWPQSVPILHNGPPPPPKNCLFQWLHVTWAHPSPEPKRHLDQFSRFLRGSLLWQTDRQTDSDRPHYSVGNNTPQQRT